MLGALFTAHLSLCLYLCTDAADSPPRMDGGAPSPGALRPEGVRDLDPAACAARCRGEGYQVVALSPRSCYCGNRLNGSAVSECFNTSSNESTMDVKGGSGIQRSSSSNQRGGNATAKGLFFPNTNLSVSPKRVQPGETFVPDVSGNLAARPDQPTAVRINSEKRTYPTNADITLQAVTDILDPVEFLWHFGDSTSTRTKSKTTTKKYRSPGQFDVVLVASDGRTSVTSEVLPLVIQKVVKLNKLIHRPSALQNQTVTVSCRVNTGSNLTFVWSFGDGTTRPGPSTVEHVYHRTGEYTVKVTAFNQVSSGSLSNHIFVVDRPCQPPPVKLMGLPKLQVRRTEVIRLGVTYESAVDCEASQGLHYTWNMLDSAGRTFPLPSTNLHRQNLIVPGYLLQYDTYTATARVQVIGSVVYSNYSITVEVMQSRPVALIQGGTNIFISKGTCRTITLDGQGSHDDDFPSETLTYSWTCKPVSAVTSSCFDQPVPALSPVLEFPATYLKANFDQFQFGLTVNSGSRSDSAELFLTVVPHIVGKVLIYCSECQGEQVNWNQPFSVTAFCEGCEIPAKDTRYSWSLYLVNASTRLFIEAPFCRSVDLGAPSAIGGNLTLSPETPRASRPHSPHTTVPQHDQAISETVVEEQIDGVSDCHSPKSRNSLCGADMSQSENPHKLLNLDKERKLQWDYFDAINEFSADLDVSADWEILDSAVEGQLDEGDPGVSAGRLPDVNFEAISSGDFPIFDTTLFEDVSSNLVHPKPSVQIREPTLLELPRDPVAGRVFESYTSTGTSSDLITFKPFSLMPNSRYMLEVTAKSQSSILGRSQLFLKTNPAPEGVSCQVQPDRGRELHTHFSIFCMSGREDLLYEYSYSVGGRPSRVLYQGADFQYYFSLPAGDPGDNYKVTIFIEIRSRRTGSSSKPCPTTVHVEPSFFRETSPSSKTDPGQTLCESGLKNLSALLLMGNPLEINNYISLLSSILNRLGEDTEAQIHMRNVLIGTICKLEIVEQETLSDSLVILKDLLQLKNKVSFASVEQVTAHIQSISERFMDSTPHSGLALTHRMLTALIKLLSSSILSATQSNKVSSTGCTAGSLTDPGDSLKRSNPPNRIERLVEEILETATQLMLKFILLKETKEHTVTTGFISIKAAYQNQTSTVIIGWTSTFYIPACLMESLFAKHRGETDPRQHGQCFLRVLTELPHAPYTWQGSPLQLSGPVVELDFYKCRRRRKISIRSLVQPIHVGMQLPQRNKSSSSTYWLLRSKINFHSFNITHEHLQESIQLTIRFRTPNSRTRPIMLLFSMFDRPTPSMHHLQKIHRWESVTARITLLPSYLSAAGVGHLALLYADFNKTSKRKHGSEAVSYNLTVESSRCLSWDSQRRSWTHQGCRTQQEDTAATVTCSCHLLRPVTVIQQPLKSSHDIIDVDPFLRAPLCDLTILGVLLAIVLLSIPGMVRSKRADETRKKNRRVHYLPDNSQSDPFLYVITIHTGLWSAAHLSAKVYIVLHGEDGSSQTKELHVPGCSLFRRNSKDTFILSTAHDLGAVSGLHVWHDNSGPSREWYIKHVEVSRAHDRRAVRLLLGHCWLAVNKGDGRLERMLRVCTQRISFTQMLSLKLLDYLADFHIWASVCCCQSPDTFTHSQRLSVCLLLLLGYACVNALIISQMDDQLPKHLIDVSPLSVTTGLSTVLCVLPAATLIAAVFRLCGIKSINSITPPGETNCFLNVHSFDDGVFETQMSWNGLHDSAREVFRKRIQDTDAASGSSPVSAHQASQRHKHEPSTTSSTLGRPSSSATMHEDAGGERLRRAKAGTHFCIYVSWILLVLLSLSCLALSAVLGMRFSSGDVLLWIHSVFVSLIGCVFLIQPAAVFLMAVIVSCWHHKMSDMHGFLGITEFDLWHQDADDDDQPRFSKKQRSYFEKRLEARRRARYLHLLRPLASAEVRKARRTRRKEALIQTTLQDFSAAVLMLCLMMCIAHGGSSNDHYRLNAAIRRQFTRGNNNNNGFTLIQSQTEWWTWTQTTLLDVLYKNSTPKSAMSSVLIGEPVLQKMEKSVTLRCLVSIATLSNPGSCSRLISAVSLGHTKSVAASKLEHLQSDIWLHGQTLALGFTLYSPALNLYTSVTLLAEQSSSGVTIPSSNVQSGRICHTPNTGDYIIMSFQLVFLLLSLLLLCQQASRVAQKGPKAYWRTHHNWIEVGLLTVTLLYYVYYVYRSSVIVELVEQLQRHDYTEHVDMSTLTACEQVLRTLRGVLLFILTIKCTTVLRMTRTLAVPVTLFTHSLSRLSLPLISGLILRTVLSCCGSPLYPVSFKSHLNWCLKTARSHITPGEVNGVFSLLSCMVCTVMGVAVVCSTFKRVKRNQSRRNALTVAQMASHIKAKASELTGRQRLRGNHNSKDNRQCQFEEFESAVDELLFRLNALTDSLHHTLPPKAHIHSPVFSALSQLHSTDSQMSARSHVLYDAPLITDTQRSKTEQTSDHPSSCTPTGGSKDKELLTCARTDDSSVSGNMQPINAELLVKAIVHEEPQRVNL